MLNNNKNKLILTLCVALFVSGTLNAVDVPVTPKQQNMPQTSVTTNTETTPPINNEQTTTSATATETNSASSESEAVTPVTATSVMVHEPYLPFYPAYPPTKQAVTEGEEALIKKGEYLAKMGDCISCHTNVKESAAPYAGGLPLATPFGTFYSPNITPDKETGIGNWSEEDFTRAMKEGRAPDGSNYFPVFPYIYFSKMSKDDIHALYVYLMSIPPVKKENKSLPFPFDVPGARLSLWGWNLLFFYPDDNAISYQMDKSPEWNRGKYIVDSLGHCSMCHTPLNLFGAPKKQYYLTGSFIDDFWAPNITQYGLHSADIQEVANVFKHGQLINQAGPVAGPMAEVNHNSLSYMTDDDRLAIATYLKTIVSEEPMGLPGMDSEPTLKRGKQVYLKACIICHQNGAMTAPLNGSSPNWYARLQRSGLSGLYRHVIGGYNSMPVKGACVTCSDNDLIAATDYLLKQSLTRSQWVDLTSGKETKYPGNGKDIYNENCSACHAESAKGEAPKIGDKDAWKPLIAQNMDVLIENTLHGDKHPKKGGCKLCSTGEVIEGIKYIVSHSKTEGNYSLW